MPLPTYNFSVTRNTKDSTGQIPFLPPNTDELPKYIDIDRGQTPKIYNISLARSATIWQSLADTRSMTFRELRLTKKQNEAFIEGG